jgi:hypothetical protein
MRGVELVGLLEPVAVAFDVDGLGAVEETIDQGLLCRRLARWKSLVLVDSPWHARSVRVFQGLAIGVLSGLGCGDDGQLPGVTDECILDTIVDARIRGGDVDCAPKYDGSIPMEILFGEQPVDETPAIACIRDALAKRRASVYLGQIQFGTDSQFRWAKLVSATGIATALGYDSSPEGQGTGSNTIFRFECAPFTKAPDLGCDSRDEGELVCSQSARTRAEYR